MLGLALVAQTQGDNQGAITWYKKVLTVDKTNIAAMGALAELGVGPTSSPTKSSTSTQGHK